MTDSRKAGLTKASTAALCPEGLVTLRHHLLLTYTVLPLGKTTTLEAGLGDLTIAMLTLGTGVEVGFDVVLV